MLLLQHLDRHPLQIFQMKCLPSSPWPHLQSCQEVVRLRSPTSTVNHSFMEEKNFRLITSKYYISLTCTKFHLTFPVSAAIGHSPMMASATNSRGPILQRLQDCSSSNRTPHSTTRLPPCHEASPVTASSAK